MGKFGPECLSHFPVVEEDPPGQSGRRGYVSALTLQCWPSSSSSSCYFTALKTSHLRCLIYLSSSYEWGSFIVVNLWSVLTLKSVKLKLVIYPQVMELYPTWICLLDISTTVNKHRTSSKWNWLNQSPLLCKTELGNCVNRERSPEPLETSW